MGKPYQKEVERLPKTYDESKGIDADGLVRALRTLAGLHTFVIGSGGSLSSALLAAELHSRFANQPATPLTPLRFVHQLSLIRGSGALFLSGGGSNPDVLESFRQAIRQECRRIVVVCGRRQSPLAKLAGRFDQASVFEFSLASGRDGFLATNSLLGICVLLARAYPVAYGDEGELPSHLHSTMPGQHNSFRAACTDICAQTEHLWQRPHTALLYGPSVEPAAIDFESRFTEAALGSVQAADLRNFAHGRHHWLAKLPQATGVLLLHSAKEASIARKTAQLLPKSLPQARLCSPLEGAAGIIGMLATTIVLAGASGRSKAFDPGRPHVPKFGRAIYHLKALQDSSEPSAKSPAAQVAIERKLDRPWSAISEFVRAQWEKAYSIALDRLTAARFTGLALDYDGTLCGAGERESGPRVEVTKQITRILSAGIPMLVVTGRGKSVGKALRDTITRELWERVRVGYYNGAQTLPLSDKAVPEQGTPQGELGGVLEKAKSLSHLCDLGQWEGRAAQITLTPHCEIDRDQVWERVQCLVHEYRAAGITVVRSGHTVDILAPGIGKNAALSFLPGGDRTVLRIGDSGRHPGNDFELLDSPYGLSCSEASSSPDSCWNLAPAGVVGVQAALYYLRCILPLRRSGHFRLRVPTKGQA